jgi:5-methylcytosine-specific restriction endonuclease McrA
MVLPKSLSTRVYIRDGWKCRNCQRRENLTPHHVIFKGRGGEDKMNNLLTLCIFCHNGVHQKNLDIVVISVLDLDLIVTFHWKGNWKP